MNLTYDDYVVCAQVAKQYPRFVQLLVAMRDEAVELLPFATKDTQIAQGRCQVLQENVTLLRTASENAAKFRTVPAQPKPSTP